MTIGYLIRKIDIKMLIIITLGVTLLMLMLFSGGSKGRWELKLFERQYKKVLSELENRNEDLTDSIAIYQNRFDDYEQAIEEDRATIAKLREEKRRNLLEINRLKNRRVEVVEMVEQMNEEQLEKFWEAYFKRRDEINDGN